MCTCVEECHPSTVDLRTVGVQLLAAGTNSVTVSGVHPRTMSFPKGVIVTPLAVSSSTSRVPTSLISKILIRVCSKDKKKESKTFTLRNIDSLHLYKS